MDAYKIASFFYYFNFYEKVKMDAYKIVPSIDKLLLISPSNGKLIAQTIRNIDKACKRQIQWKWVDYLENDLQAFYIYFPFLCYCARREGIWGWGEGIRNQNHATGDLSFSHLATSPTHSKVLKSIILKRQDVWAYRAAQNMRTSKINSKSLKYYS